MGPGTAGAALLGMQTCRPAGSAGPDMAGAGHGMTVPAPTWRVLAPAWQCLPRHGGCWPSHAASGPHPGHLDATLRWRLRQPHHGAAVDAAGGRVNCKGAGPAGQGQPSGAGGIMMMAVFGTAASKPVCLQGTGGCELGMQASAACTCLYSTVGPQAVSNSTPYRATKLQGRGKAHGTGGSTLPSR